MISSASPMPTEHEPVDKVSIAACISVPRIGWNDSWGCIHDALQPFGIPLRRVSGAYWEQGIQTVFESCVDQGLDWLLSLDYDAIFTPDQLNRLMRDFNSATDADAMGALQVRRSTSGTDSACALASVAGESKRQVSPNVPICVDTLHFGMTLIRCSALMKMPKPWFWAQPGPDGTWTHPEHVDADMTFWHRWKRAGNTVYLHPGIRIGHLEMRVSQFDDELNPSEITMSGWRSEHAFGSETSIRQEPA